MSRTVYAVLLAIGLAVLSWEVVALASPGAMPVLIALPPLMGVGVGYLHVTRRGWW